LDEGMGNSTVDEVAALELTINGAEWVDGT
jgi:hypothetical protein